MVQLLLSGWVETKRWMDFRKPQSQAEPGSFVGLEGLLKGSGENAYPGGVFDPFGFAKSATPRSAFGAAQILCACAGEAILTNSNSRRLKTVAWQWWPLSDSLHRQQRLERGQWTTGWTTLAIHGQTTSPPMAFPFQDCEYPVQWDDKILTLYVVCTAVA